MQYIKLNVYPGLYLFLLTMQLLPNRPSELEVKILCYADALKSKQSDIEKYRTAMIQQYVKETRINSLLFPFALFDYERYIKKFNQELENHIDFSTQFTKEGNLVSQQLISHLEQKNCIEI